MFQTVSLSSGRAIDTVDIGLYCLQISGMLPTKLTRIPRAQADQNANAGTDTAARNTPTLKYTVRAL